MDNSYISFRKAKVGGFNKKDVINYIEKMRNDFYDYKKAVEATVDSLNDKIRELEALNGGIAAATSISGEVSVEDKETRCADPISDINASAVRLRMVADELCRNLTDFMCTVSVEAKDEKSDECECDLIDEATTTSEENCAVDKASEILSRSVNFSFLADDKKIKNEDVKADAVQSKSVLDKLSSSAFFN